MKPNLVIGIAGGSGSGKTTLVDRLMNGPYSEHISVVPHDAYYKNSAELPKFADGSANWDHPDALDNNRFLLDVRHLCDGVVTQRPVYDFKSHSRTDETVAVVPKPILLLEGILLFSVPQICRAMDLRIFIDTPPDIRIIRRMIRDVNERGRTVSSVASQYEQSVRPMHEQFVEPSRVHAHISIPWLTDNPEAIEFLNCRISAQFIRTSIARKARWPDLFLGRSKEMFWAGRRAWHHVMNQVHDKKKKTPPSLPSWMGVREPAKLSG